VIVLALGESAAMSGSRLARRTRPARQPVGIAQENCRCGKPVVLLVFSGRPLVLTSAAQNAQAILEVWFPGIESGDAIVHLLYGEESPSGKLPMSFPESIGQEPLYYNQFPTGRPANNADLNEPRDRIPDLFRAISMRQCRPVPFGFGLSYTTFSYSAVAVSLPSVPLRAEVPEPRLSSRQLHGDEHRNRTATEVVQCYVRNRGASLEQPVRSLRVSSA